MENKFHTPTDSKPNPSDDSKKSNAGTGDQKSSGRIDSIQIPKITLRKGGGALKGIGEKFEVSSAKGKK